MADYKFRVGGLTYLDRMEFEEELNKTLPAGDSADIEYAEEPVPDGAFGEPVTVAVIVGGYFALKALIAYLVLRGRSDHFEQKIEIEYPDGRREIHTVKLKLSKDEPADVQVLKQLSSVSGIPFAQLAGAADGQ